MLPQITDWVEKVQEAVFSCEFAVVGQEFSDGISLLAELANNLPKKELDIFNEIIAMALEAQQSQDYLLLADILEYKLKPLAKAHCKQTGGEGV